MTPGARVAAAIEILDLIAAGAAAEQALTGWARGHRFAGSGDRAAIRDHVFDALRRRRSAAWVGGGGGGRAQMLGVLRLEGVDPASLFTGAGYAPAPPGPAEGGQALQDAPETVRLDWPDWLIDETRRGLGAHLEQVLQASRARAPVFLRVNAARGDPQAALGALAADGIAATPHPEVQGALILEGPARGLRDARAFREGLVELQDAASQAVVAALDIAPGMRVLDLCAGGGGKALALAARGARVLAHDIAPERMKDLPARAERAGARIDLVSRPEHGAPHDLVFVDAPCSGSGAWRRAPEGKWRLTPGGLDALNATQDALLSRAADLSRGALAYVTCSLLERENGDRVQAFLGRAPGWRLATERRFHTGPLGDGFYLALLERE